MTHNILMTVCMSHMQMLMSRNVKGEKCAQTWCFVSKKTGDLVLAVFLFFIRQQLVNKLPDHLFGWSIQHREHIHDQRVYIPVAMETQAR